MEELIFTIGHSSHSYEHFLSLIQAHRVNAIADVRTTPFSRHYPHFNGEVLRSELKLDGISYVFLGNELGGRPSGPDFYCDGVADYEKMAKTKAFEDGILRVIEGTKKFRVALMCSEHDPLDCHRCLLVARELRSKGHSLRHILSDGTLVSQEEIEDKLLALAGRSNSDLLMTTFERLATAYRERSRKVAFANPASSEKVDAANR